MNGLQQPPSTSRSGENVQDNLPTKLSQVLSDFGANVIPDGIDVVVEYFGANNYSQDIAESENDQPLSKSNFPTSISDAWFQKNATLERDLFQDMEEETDELYDEVFFNDLNFLEEGCGCPANCVKLFERTDILESRYGSKDYDIQCDQHMNHQHLLLLGSLNTIVRTGTKTMQKEHAPKNREMTYAEYLFRGVKVCRKFYQYVFYCGEKRLKNVRKHLVSHGLNQKTHKNTQTSSKVIPSKWRTGALNFIRNYALQNALILPGRFPAHANSSRLNSDLMILPCTMRKNYLYELYKRATENFEIKPIGMSLWYDLWKDFCPNIIIQRSEIDLCNVCHEQTVCLRSMQTFSENEKLCRLRQWMDHLEMVQIERRYYNQCILECMQGVLGSDSTSRLGTHLPCSYQSKMHYSFDFVQQISLPHARQVGPLYFLNGYKVALFGIAAEPLQQFVLYIIPEAYAKGKGSNVLVSLLHHFFENFGLGESDVVCHTDNSCRQNKNNCLIQYGAWRIMTGRHKSFQLSFLPEGHSRFAPDIYFGMFKNNFRSFDANNLEDVYKAAITACTKNDTIIGVVVANETGNVHINSYDWNNFFSNFNPTYVENLTCYNHFCMNSANPGVVKYNLASQDSGHEQTSVFKSHCFENVQENFPSKLEPAGLSNHRMKYLYERVRPFVSEESKNLLCPKFEESIFDMDMRDPTYLEDASIATPHISIEEIAQSQIGGERKRPRCGYCGDSGHRNMVLNGVPYCPKRRSVEN